MAKANADDQEDELEQLRKMYKSEELTSDTADIVVKRAIRSLEVAKVTLGMSQERAEKVKQHAFPIAKQEVLDSVEGVRQKLESCARPVAGGGAPQGGCHGRHASRTPQAERKLADLNKDLANFSFKAPADGVVFYGQGTDGLAGRRPEDAPRRRTPHQRHRLHDALHARQARRGAHGARGAVGVGDARDEGEGDPRRLPRTRLRWHLRRRPRPPRRRPGSASSVNQSTAGRPADPAGHEGDGPDRGRRPEGRPAGPVGDFQRQGLGPRGRTARSRRWRSSPAAPTARWSRSAAASPTATKFWPRGRNEIALRSSYC